MKPRILLTVLAMLAAGWLARRAEAVVIDNYVWQFPVVTNVTGADDLKAILQTEVQQVLDAGHLRPLHPYFADIPNVESYLLYNEPFRTVTALAWAYPYLTAAQQTAVRTYVANELNTLAYSPWRVNSWENCQLAPDSAGATREEYPRDRLNWGPSFPEPARPTIQTYYGLWLYAYRSGDWITVQNKWSNIKNDYNGRSSLQGNIYGTYCAHIAMARLADHFGDTAQRDTAISNLQAQMNAGTTFATVETNCWNRNPDYWNAPYRDMWDARKDGLVYRGFMFLNTSPEVARYLNDNVRTDVLARHNLGKSMYPNWWLRRPVYWCRWTGDEGWSFPHEIMGMMMPIERWVVGANSTALRRYMRGAPVGSGDCYWLEGLVSTIEAHGTAAWTDVRGGTPPPPPAAPSGLSATAVSSSQINLAWTDNSSNETGFRVERKTGAGGTYAEIATPSANATSYQNTGLTASTTYYYQVRAYNTGGNSAYSNEANATTQAAGSPPAAPSNLTATAISSSQINLAWTDNAGTETGFKVERKTGAGGTYAQIATPAANATSYSDTGLAASTTYYYRIRATNIYGDSAYSNEANATTQSGGGGGNLLTNGDFETGSVSGWSWNGSSTGGSISTADKHGGTYSAKFDGTVGKPELDQMFNTTQGTNYTVTAWLRITSDTGSDWGGFRVQVTAADWTTLGSVGAMRQSTYGSNWFQISFNFTAVAGTQSRLQISSFSGAGITQVVYVDDVVVTGPGGSPPAAPGNLTAAAISSSQINLTWTDNSSNETGFKLERKLGSGGTYSQIATPAANATSYSDTGLAASTTYYYHLRATNGSGDSAFSNEANATTQGTVPAAPSNLTATAVSSSQINLAWTDNSSNETGFKLERKTGAGGTYSQIATPAANATSYNNTGLAASTTYYYRIRATNGSGDSAYSNEANATTQSASAVGLGFNGTSAQASRADTASLDINGSATTMEAWVYCSGPDVWNSMGAVGRWEIDTAGQGWSRFHGLSGYANGAQWKFGLVIAGLYKEALSGTNLPKNQWVHLAGSYDGSNVRFFINGTQAASVAATGNLTTNDNSWYVGSTGGGGWFQGTIDEVRISNNARYTANFTVPSAAFSSDSNTKALWHLNENSGSTSADASGNSNTLTLTITTWTTGKF